MYVLWRGYICFSDMCREGKLTVPEAMEGDSLNAATEFRAPDDHACSMSKPARFLYNLRLSFPSKECGDSRCVKWSEH